MYVHIVAFIPLIFSAGVNGGECKSIRLAGGVSTCTLVLAVLGPGAPIGGESGGMGALLLDDALEDGVEEPASVGATESEVPPRSGLVLLFLLLLQPLLGYSVMQSDE